MKVTIDTNLVDHIDLARTARAAKFEIFITSVTNRELLPSCIKSVVRELILEVCVFGESTLGNCVLGADQDDEILEKALKIIRAQSGMLNKA